MKTIEYKLRTDGGYDVYIDNRKVQGDFPSLTEFLLWLKDHNY